MHLLNWGTSDKADLLLHLSNRWITCFLGRSLLKPRDRRRLPWSRPPSLFSDSFKLWKLCMCTWSFETLSSWAYLNGVTQMVCMKIQALSVVSSGCRKCTNQQERRAGKRWVACYAYFPASDYWLRIANVCRWCIELSRNGVLCSNSKMLTCNKIMWEITLVAFFRLRSRWHLRSRITDECRLDW